MKTIYLVVLALWMSNCTEKPKQQEVMKKTATVMEVVTFKVNSTLSDVEIKAKLLSLTECASAYEGYIDRTLAKNDKEEWIDVVYWESLEQAELAAEKIMEDEKALAVFALIDEKSMVFVL